jgi:hypothetical protein
MVSSNTNPPELKLGHEVIHGRVYPLHSDLVNMNILTLNVEQVMEFQRGLIVKPILENFKVWKSVFLALFQPLK